MNVAEATEMLARHARNAERIQGMKMALIELRSDDRAVAKLLVGVAALSPARSAPGAPSRSTAKSSGISTTSAPAAA